MNLKKTLKYFSLAAVSVLAIGALVACSSSSEKKTELKRRPGLTTQLPSAMIYLLYGLYSDLIKKELSSYPDDLPENLTI